MLPICTKLLERLIHDRIYDHWWELDFLTDSQSGFRTRHSTTTCLLSFLDSIFKEIDAGQMSGVLFLDLKKAFDSVNHQILLNKLVDTGLDGTAVKWINHTLRNDTRYAGSMT